jgi:hypothetical protein
MGKTLVIDPQTREVRLAMTDLYEGQHERDEFRVLSPGGNPVHEVHPGEWDHLLGKPVHGAGGSWYIHRPPHADVTFRTEHLAVGPTARTGCRRHGHPRRKCDLCTAEAAR